MSSTPDQPSGPSAGRKSVNTLTKVLNLASASITVLNEPVKVQKKAPPPELYFNDNSYTLRLDDDVSRFGDHVELMNRLRELPEKEIDLVFAGRTALDLSFVIPNGPFGDLKAMIESELAYRSPIQKEQCVWFWTAQETENGDWQVEGAIVLKTAIDWVLEALKDTGKTINLARRHRGDGSLRVGVTPDWQNQRSRLAQATGVFGRLRNVPPALRFPLAGFAVFAVSIIALFVAQSVRYSAVSDRASVASMDLQRAAASAAVARGLQDRRDQGLARVILMGTLAETLPDDTWIDQIILEENDLTLIGFAPSAAEVTRLLATLPNLSDIEFGAPVTRDNTQNIERFRINAQLNGPTS
ncbi:MAG: PilN domain-containing protein [Pseudomonadota bacterium]